MATYTQQCSQVGSYSYASNFSLYVVLSDRDGNPNTNKSIVDYNVYCQSNGSGSLSANHNLYFELNGQIIRNENVYVNVRSPYAYIGIASGSMEVEHNSDGTKGVWFSASINASSGYGLSAGKAETFWLNNIPRYANFTEHYVESTGLNSISVKWNADAHCDWLQYSVNGGSWVDSGGSPYTISGLNPNTQYNIRTRIRRADSGLWTESGYINGTTKDIARVTSAPNINLGDNATINITNPAGASIKYFVEILNPKEQVLNRNAVVGSNTIVFSDAELDQIYKKMGTSNSTTLRFGVSTNDSYWDWQDKTCSLTGNQKTIKVKDNNQYKRGKVWIKDSGTWKRAVIWAKNNNEWKRGI